MHTDSAGILTKQTDMWNLLLFHKHASNTEDNLVFNQPNALGDNFQAEQ